MAGTVGQRAMAVCLLLLCSGSFVVSFNSGVLAPGSVTVRGRFGVCPSLRATRAGAADVTMGMRDKFKATLAALGAAFSITTAPHSASAAPSRVAEAPAQEDVQQPMSLQPMMLPSQASHYKQMARGGDHIVVATAKQLALDRRVHFVVGAGVAGGAGYVILSNSNKKKNDDYRKMLSSKSGINIDASILDEKRVNRPGGKTVQYTNAPKFGSYRPPPEKLMRDVKDKYVWKTKEDADEQEVDLYSKEMYSKINLDIFKDVDTEKNGDIPYTNGDTVKKDSDLDADSTTQVELVDDNQGPKTAAQKALEEELQTLNMDEALRQAMATDPSAMDPSIMAAALPALQEQLQELMKGGISKEEINEVKASFRDMGIDLEDMFSKIDEMERAGLTDAVGPEGTEFFKTLRTIIDTA